MRYKNYPLFRAFQKEIKFKTKKSNILVSKSAQLCGIFWQLRFEC